MSTHREPQTEAPRSWRDRDLRSERERRFERTRRPVAQDRPLGPRRPANEPGSRQRWGWRGDVTAASGLNVLAGIWLIIAPFVLGYGNGDPYWNDIVFGAIVVVLAGARALGAYRQAWMSWLNMLIGAWIFISAFWLDATSRASWNDIILGAIIFVLGAVSASATAERPVRRTDPTLR
jgi:hypothetical protein